MGKSGKKGGKRMTKKVLVEKLIALFQLKANQSLGTKQIIWIHIR